MTLLITDIAIKVCFVALPRIFFNVRHHSMYTVCNFTRKYLWYRPIATLFNPSVPFSKFSTGAVVSLSRFYHRYFLQGIEALLTQ